MQPSKRISIMKSLVLRFLCVKHFLLLIMHGIRGFCDDMLVRPALHLQTVQLCSSSGEAIPNPSEPDCHRCWHRNPFLCKYYTRSCRTINKTFSGMLCTYNGLPTAMWENTSAAAGSVMNETRNEGKIICHLARAFLSFTFCNEARQKLLDEICGATPLLRLNEKKLALWRRWIRTESNQNGRKWWTMSARSSHKT